MTTFIQILMFLIQVFGSLYLSVILLRFLLQTARADFYNPISQMLVKLTNPVLIPLRRIIPGFWGIDVASIVFALLFHWLIMQIMILISAGLWIPPPLIIGWSLIGIALNIVMLYLFASFVIFVSSFIAPHSRHPVLLLIRQLVEPLMSPIRRFIPPAGGMDFSLFFVGIFLVIIRMVITGIGQTIDTPLQFLFSYG